MKRLGTVNATNRSSAQIKKLIFKLDHKNPKLGVSCDKDTLVIIRVSNHAKQSGAKIGQQILEVQDTRVNTFKDLKRQLQKSIQEKRDRFIIYVCETNESKAIARKHIEKKKSSTPKKRRKEKSEHIREKDMQRIGALLHGKNKTKTPSKIALIGKEFLGEEIVSGDSKLVPKKSDRTLLGLQNSVDQEEQKNENDNVIRACESRIQNIIREFDATNISYMPMKSYLINKFGMAQFERVKDTIKVMCRSSARDGKLSGSPLVARDNSTSSLKIEKVVDSDDEDLTDSSSGSEFTEIVAGIASSSSSSSSSEEEEEEVKEEEKVKEKEVKEEEKVKEQKEEPPKIVGKGTSHRESDAVPMLGLTEGLMTEEGGDSSSYDGSDPEMYAALVIASDDDDDDEENGIGHIL